MAEEKKGKANVVKAKKKAAVGKNGRPKMKFGARVKKFFKDYRSELKKITWPVKKKEEAKSIFDRFEAVIKMTGIVLTAIIFIAAVVGVLDLLFGLGINAISGLGELFRN